MADEPTSLAAAPAPVAGGTQSPSAPNPPPAANTPEARTEAGEIKTPAPSPSTQTDKSDTQPKAEGPPEKYTFTAPEGYEVDSEFVDKATPILRELGISQEGAQRLFDLVQGKVSGAEEAIYSAYEELRGKWRAELSADKVLGNGKDNLSAETQQNIAAAIGSLPADLQSAFRDAMNITGAGDNPAFVRALNHFGAGMREGKIVAGNQPSPLGQRAPGGSPRSAASALYPNLPSAS